MKKVFYMTLIVAVAALALTDCCPCRKTRKSAKPLTGTTWHLIQLEGRDVNFDAEMFNVTFGEDGKFNGRGACNSFGGNYKADTAKETLEIGTVAATRALCPDIEVEQKLFNELDGATHYEIDGSMLLLLKDGEIRAIFSAAESSSKQ